MYRRKRKTGSNSIQSSLGSDRGSDIAAPNNTSLAVNRSKMTDDSPDDLPTSVTAALYDDDEASTLGLARPSTSILKSMTEKKQSTPISRVLQDTTNIKSEIFSERSSGSSEAKFQIPDCRSSFFLEVLSQCGADEIAGQGSFRLCEYLYLND